jgi:hypothetical protein
LIESDAKIFCVFGRRIQFKVAVPLCEKRLVTMSKLMKTRKETTRTESDGIHTILQAVGHTFKPGADHFMPKAEFSSLMVSFPPAHVGDPAYQTSVIFNRGDTPLK